MKNKNLLPFVLSIFFICSLASCGGTADKVILTKYKFVAEEVNKQTPLTISEGITLDKAEALDGRIFKYHYTFIENPTMPKEEFEERTKAEIASGLKGMKEMNSFREDKIKLSYVYKDKDGNIFCEITLKPEEY